MNVTAVVGASYGDEGKGRMVDALAAEFDFVVRFQGGANAGHTVINQHGKFVLHQLPSGVFSERACNVLGPGVALDLELLAHELDDLGQRGFRPKLAISERAQLVLPLHRELDALEEERLGARAFGSTRRGIAPFYADKAAKVGVMLDDLFDEPRLRDRIEGALEVKNALLESLYRQPARAAQPIVSRLLRLRERVASHACDTARLLREALRADRAILLEAQLGALRDPDHGTHPFVSSSSPLAGFASVGAGIPAASITRVIAVAKAYMSAVGEGPFVTELMGTAAEALRARGGDAGEYGATTGRPRRVGFFDAVATRYGCQLQGATEAALTGLDALGHLDEIPICASYEIDGGVTSDFPTPRRLRAASPRYERLPGWKREIRDVQSFSDLPATAQAYVARVERLIETPIRWVSVGPERRALLERHC